jgi:hypothetical protein
MDRGRIVEAGRHEELVAAGGLYAELFERQFGKVLDLGNGGGESAASADDRTA